jgi:hypothetical protein
MKKKDSKKGTINTVLSSSLDLSDSPVIVDKNGNIKARYK